MLFNVDLIKFVMYVVFIIKSCLVYSVILKFFIIYEDFY